MISVAATRKVARLTSMGSAYAPEASRFPELFTLVVRSPKGPHRELHGVATRSGDAFPGDGCAHRRVGKHSRYALSRVPNFDEAGVKGDRGETQYVGLPEVRDDQTALDEEVRRPQRIGMGNGQVPTPAALGRRTGNFGS